MAYYVGIPKGGRAEALANWEMELEGRRLRAHYLRNDGIRHGVHEGMIIQSYCDPTAAHAHPAYASGYALMAWAGSAAQFLGMCWRGEAHKVGISMREIFEEIMPEPKGN